MHFLHVKVSSYEGSSAFRASADSSLPEASDRSVRGRGGDDAAVDSRRTWFVMRLLLVEEMRFRRGDGGVELQRRWRLRCAGREVMGTCCDETRALFTALRSDRAELRTSMVKVEIV